SRKIRRMVRDHNFRGHSAEQTLMMWNSVRAGEDSNIFPYQENSDFMFNSILTYELAVLKKYAMPLLQSVNNYCPKYLEAQRLIRLLDHLYNIQDDVVPSNSILREFIGGSVFNY
ncbi:MAG: nucleoside kinase, partial [Candidatus Cloacimonadota bacterium]